MATACVTAGPQPSLIETMVDLKGRPVDRAKTGRWKACLFLIGYEACERMSFYGIAANLVVYLANELREGTVASSRNVSNWGGAIWITPLLGAFIADTYLGRFWTFTIFSAVYIVGMACLTLAVSLPSLKPPPCSAATPPAMCPTATTAQVGFFYFSLYLLCLGTGGTKPNISAFGADQFDGSHPAERLQKASFFNWWMFSICFGCLLAQTGLVYIQDNVGWGWGYGIPTIGMIISACIFLRGIPYYRHKKLDGNSPVLQIAQVFVCAFRNMAASLSDDGSQLHELKPKEYGLSGRPCLHHTPQFRFLDKAAVRQSSSDTTPANPWKLCSVTQVEEAKSVVGLLPIWLGCLLFTSIMTNVNTFFIKQGSTMERAIGHHFRIPPASLGGFVTLSMIVLVPAYDRALVPLLRGVTGRENGVTLLQRMGAGLFVQVVVMVVAAMVEGRRVRVGRRHGLLDTPGVVIPMSIWWLLPQYVLIGVADTFTGIATLEFFYDQAPSNMKSIGTAMYNSNIGMGYFCGSLLITMVDKVTGRHGKEKSWLVDNLNRCRLDRFYWLMAAMAAVNAVVFVLLARQYRYGRREGDEVEMVHGLEDG